MTSYGDIYESITHRDNSLVHLEHRRRAALVGLEKHVVTVNHHVAHVSSEEPTVRSLAGEQEVTKEDTSTEVQATSALSTSTEHSSALPGTFQWKVREYTNIYFKVFHPVWPFLHKRVHLVRLRHRA